MLAKYIIKKKKDKKLKGLFLGLRWCKVRREEKQRPRDLDLKKPKL